MEQDHFLQEQQTRLTEILRPDQRELTRRQHLADCVNACIRSVGRDDFFTLYALLQSRACSVGESRRLNYRSMVIDLHRTPLEIPALRALGQRLRRIHEIAQRGDAEAIVTDAFIEQVCQTQQRMGLLPEVQLCIKPIVRYLDMAEQDGTPEGVDLTDQIIATHKEIVQEKTAQPPAWDA